jgi:putative FmdB family regulatory protein
MPIFDYQCTACGHTFDILQKAGEGALRKCPECGKLKLKKLLAAPNFHLKGSGWYKTDFRDKSSGKGKPSEGKSDDKGSGTSDGGKKGHSLDSAKGHSHDHGHGHSHSHGPGGHTHGPGGHKH